MNVTQQIGICGTFDVENYGDLLFPLIAEVELQERLGPITLHKYSYRQKSPPAWHYHVNSLTELPQMIRQMDGMIIGGGDLIRFDKGIAPGYIPPSSAIHHPTGFWLTPMLIAAQAGCPVVWNAPGVYLEIPVWAKPLVELAISLSSYVNVRNNASRLARVRVWGGYE
jgi:lipopolysaccharide transport system ATP-binding protein